MPEPEPYECGWFAGGDPGQQCPEPLDAEDGDLCAAHQKMWDELMAICYDEED